jgi:MFS family permease
MADTKHASASSDDDDKSYPVDGYISPAAHNRLRTPEAVAAEYNLSEKKLLRKLDLYLVPGVALLYLLSFLDRANVANARLEGLEKDLGLSADGSDYLNGLTLFFVGYISLEVVWNLILKRVGPRVWLPLIGVVWGVVSTLQGCVVNNGQASGRAGFLAIRFFLGLTEGEFEGTMCWSVRTKTDGFILQAGCFPESCCIF